MKELSIHELNMVGGGFSVFGMSPALSAATVNATMSASTYTFGSLLAGDDPTLKGVVQNAAAGAVLGSKVPANVFGAKNLVNVNGAGAIGAAVGAVWEYGANKTAAALEEMGL